MPRSDTARSRTKTLGVTTIRAPRDGVYSRELVDHFLDAHWPVPLVAGSVQELIERLDRIGVRSVKSQADWTNHDLVRFFADSRFTLAPRWTLERAVNEPLEESVETE